MARGKNQKRKLLVLLEYLRRQSDEEHPVSMEDLLAELERFGITAERKSIYDDLDTLREFGVDVVKAGVPVRGYFLGSREFELAELKLLVDAVQSSRFLTEGKSRALIHKMEGLASQWQAKSLQRQVHVANRVKTMNESIYYNIDTIHAAISQEKKVAFRYFEWVVSFQGDSCREKRFRHGGQEYRVSPWALTWDNENYYLIGYDGASRQGKHYRVDKMEGLRVLEEKREGQESFRNFDMAQYSKAVFGMFGGKPQRVELCFADSLIGPVSDRFGKDINIRREEGGRFSCSAQVAVSPQFFGWLAGFGKDARLLAPEPVALQYRQWLQETLQAMGGSLPEETGGAQGETQGNDKTV